MLRSLSMNGIFLNYYKPLPVRHFDKLSAGSEPVEGLRESFAATCRSNGVMG